MYDVLIRLPPPEWTQSRLSRGSDIYLGCGQFIGAFILFAVPPSASTTWPLLLAGDSTDWAGYLALRLLGSQSWGRHNSNSRCVCLGVANTESLRDATHPRQGLDSESY